MSHRSTARRDGKNWRGRESSDRSLLAGHGTNVMACKPLCSEANTDVAADNE